MKAMDKTILEVQNLKVTFRERKQEVQVIRGTNFTVQEGEVLGIVGESGSGKSVMMKAVMGILPPNAKVTGDVLKLGDKDLNKINSEEYRKLRGKEMTMIFQDPMTALNPLVKIGKQIEEVILRHNNCSTGEAKQKAIDILKKVGIAMPEQRVKQYPHEFSGGMRQRVLIAMALACEPKLLIADEPTTALDVTIQAQILELLQELKEEYKTSIILITHDMGVVASMCSKIVIMYGGLIMESGTAEEIFYEPKHPYTKALLRAIPSLDLKEGERLQSIAGLPPSLVHPPSGCPFAERCEFVSEECHESFPPYSDFSDTHSAACFLNRQESV